MYVSPSSHDDAPEEGILTYTAHHRRVIIIIKIIVEMCAFKITTIIIIMKICVCTFHTYGAFFIINIFLWILMQNNAVWLK